MSTNFSNVLLDIIHFRKELDSGCIVLSNCDRLSSRLQDLSVVMFKKDVPILLDSIRKNMPSNDVEGIIASWFPEDATNEQLSDAIGEVVSMLTDTQDILSFLLVSFDNNTDDLVNAALEDLNTPEEGSPKEEEEVVVQQATPNSIEEERPEPVVTQKPNIDAPKSLEEKVMQLNQTCLQYKEEIDKLNEELSSYKSQDNSSLKGVIDNLNHEITGKNKIISDLNSKINKLQEELDDYASNCRPKEEVDGDEIDTLADNLCDILEKASDEYLGDGIKTYLSNLLNEENSIELLLTLRNLVSAFKSLEGGAN